MEIKKILKSCLNPKVFVGIVAVIILLLYIFVPQIAKYSWILFLLVCPLSMVIMMSMMHHNQDKPNKVFLCPECGFSYKEAEWAKKCAAWCREHHTCNVEITKHAVHPVK